MLVSPAAVGPGCYPFALVNRIGDQDKLPEFRLAASFISRIKCYLQVIKSNPNNNKKFKNLQNYFSNLNLIFENNFHPEIIFMITLIKSLIVY